MSYVCMELYPALCYAQHTAVAGEKHQSDTTKRVVSTTNKDIPTSAEDIYGNPTSGIDRSLHAQAWSRVVGRGHGVDRLPWRRWLFVHTWIANAVDPLAIISVHLEASA